MSRSSTLILLGVLVILAPFLGLPAAWLHVILPVLGLIIVVIGFLIRTDHVSLLRKTTTPVSSPSDASPIA